MNPLFIILGLFVLVIGLIAWSLYASRQRGKIGQKLEVETTGREQRETFDKAGDAWDAGGGLAGRMLDHDNDPSTPPEDGPLDQGGQPDGRLQGGTADDLPRGQKFTRWVGRLLGRA